MKQLALILLSVIGLVGCGTVPVPASDAALAADDGIDYAKIARVEQVANQRGIFLRWVSLPRKQAVAAGS